MKRCTEDSVLNPIDEFLAIDTADFFKALSDPGRIKILMLLSEREICVQHLADSLDMSISAVSHQLRLLRQQHLVRFVKDGKKNYYTLDDEHVSQILEVALVHLGFEEEND